MKSITTAVFLVFITVSTSMAADLGGSVKLGYDFSGTHTLSAYGLEDEQDVDAGFSFSGELIGHINKNFDIGFGAAFQLPRELENNNGEFQFFPIYGTMRLRAGTDQFDPYLVGQLGYAFMDGDSTYRGTGYLEAELEGGLYYGIGIGCIVNNGFLIELLYSMNNGTGRINSLNLEGDIEYERMTMNVGWSF